MIGNLENYQLGIGCHALKDLPGKFPLTSAQFDNQARFFEIYRGKHLFGQESGTGENGANDFRVLAEQQQKHKVGFKFFKKATYHIIFSSILLKKALKSRKG